MKYLLIVDDYLPYSIKAAALMMQDLALEFMAHGHEVSILTPNPFQKERLSVQNISGVETIFFKCGEIKNIGKIRRAINESMISQLAWAATRDLFREKHYDGIVYYSPTIFWGVLVRKLKKMWNCRTYLILRDVFPQWTADSGLMKRKSPVFWYFKFFEWINFRQANRIGVMSPSNLAFFKRTRKHTEHFEVLYNWAVHPTSRASDVSYRSKLGLENKIVFFFGGNIGHAQHMIYMVNLAIRFKNNPDVHFLFVGKGDEFELVKHEKVNHQLTNLTLLPPVDQKSYFSMMSEFDIGLFSLHPNHKTHNFPAKIFGYMAYELPVLGCVNRGNDLKEVLNEASVGYVLDSGDEEGLYQAALKLISSRELRASMGKNGKQLLHTNYSVTVAYKQILKTLKGDDSEQ